MSDVEVAIILPIHNGEFWLNDCFTSVLSQQFEHKLEISVHDDSSTDSTEKLLNSWRTKLLEANISCRFSKSTGGPFGVGYAKNRALENSTGTYLCFLDVDDVMHPLRIQKQYEAALLNDNALIGCKFHREPEGSTERYTKWANSITPSQLYSHIYTSHGPTLIMPTWFCSRETFNKVGQFSEKGKGTPEDLIFFYEHLRMGGKLIRVDTDLLTYRYHSHATTFSVKEEEIRRVNLQEFEKQVISKWSSFTIWNAGKQGRRFFRMLSEEHRRKVNAFCDVDAKKLNKGFYIYEESKVSPKPRISILHFKDATKPFVVCMKMDLTGGGLEENLQSLNLVEGKDYYWFS